MLTEYHGRERFHYVLKCGCAIEKLRERSIDKTTVLILMYSIIAAMILNMTYETVDYMGWPKRAPSDGPPGVKTIWIGLMKLYILLAYQEYLA
jgi:hypothetical protein